MITMTCEIFNNSRQFSGNLHTVKKLTIEMNFCYDNLPWEHLTSVNCLTLDNSSGEIIREDITSDLLKFKLANIKTLLLINFPLELCPWEQLSSLQKLYLRNYQEVNMDHIRHLVAPFVSVNNFDYFLFGQNTQPKIEEMIFYGGMLIFPYTHSTDYPSLKILRLDFISVDYRKIWHFTQLEHLAIMVDQHYELSRLELFQGHNLTRLQKLQIPYRHLLDLKGKHSGSEKRLIACLQKREFTAVSYDGNQKYNSHMVDLQKRAMCEADPDVTHEISVLISDHPDGSSVFENPKEPELYKWFWEMQFSNYDENDLQKIQATDEIIKYLRRMVSDTRIHPIYLATNYELCLLLRMFDSDPIYTMRFIQTNVLLRQLIKRNNTHPFQVWHAFLSAHSYDSIRDLELTHPCVMRNFLCSLKAINWFLPPEILQLIWHSLYFNTMK
jgi:hypothetical protein